MQLGYELLDISVHYGNKGTGIVKAHPLYKRVDQVVNLEDKFALVVKHSNDVYCLAGSKVLPIMDKVLFLYDDALKRVAAFVNVAADRHRQIVEYVSKTYSCVTVHAKDCWLRLDFDKDGSVTVQDLKNSMIGLYEFLKDFKFLEEMSNIKCQLYQQAIEYMNAELQTQSKQASKKKSSSKLSGAPTSNSKDTVLNGASASAKSEKVHCNGKGELGSGLNSTSLEQNSLANSSASAREQ